MRKAALLLLVLVLAGCAGGDENVAAPPRTEPTAGVQALDNVLALRSDFEADAGKTRVILLLSPT